MPRWVNFVAPALLIAQTVSASCLAEEQKLSGSSPILLPGALGKVESYGPLGYWRLCSPQSVGLTEWRTDYLQGLIKPTTSQMELIGRLQAASAAAKNTIASSCAKEALSTGPGHITEMEKRLGGLLNAIKMLREPYEALYASLDNRQKATLDGLGPSRRGWSW